MEDLWIIKLPKGFWERTLKKNRTQICLWSLSIVPRTVAALPAVAQPLPVLWVLHRDALSTGYSLLTASKTPWAFQVNLLSGEWLHEAWTNKQFKLLKHSWEVSQLRRAAQGAREERRQVGGLCWPVLWFFPRHGGTPNRRGSIRAVPLGRGAFLTLESALSLFRDRTKWKAAPVAEGLNLLALRLFCGFALSSTVEHQYFDLSSAGFF